MRQLRIYTPLDSPFTGESLTIPDFVRGTHFTELCLDWLSIANLRFDTKVSITGKQPFYGKLVLRAKPINHKYAIFRHFKVFALL